MTPAERVRDRMRHWMDTTHTGQREFAADLKKTQVWLQKILKGENHVRLKDLDQIADAMRTTASELVRGEDDRYTVEVTPTELRILENLRRSEEVLRGIMSILHLKDVPEPKPGPTKKRGRPLNSELAKRGA